MVGSEIIPALRAEIQNYLGIPYHINNPPLRLPQKPDNVLLGKGTAKEIAIQTIDFANRENIKILDLSDQQLYNFQKKHKLGIDCSGLVFHLLKFIKPDLELIGDGGVPQTVTRVSAKQLTGPQNSLPVKNYSQIQTADLIRLDGGQHVMLIVEKIDDTIYYVHSSRHTLEKGVHYGQIKITNPNKDLSHQQWSDQTRDGKSYSSLFDVSKGDGIFRLSIFS